MIDPASGYASKLVRPFSKNKSREIRRLDFIGWNCGHNHHHGWYMFFFFFFADRWHTCIPKAAMLPSRISTRHDKSESSFLSFQSDCAIPLTTVFVCCCPWHGMAWHVCCSFVLHWYRMASPDTLGHFSQVKWLSSTWFVDGVFSEAISM